MKTITFDFVTGEKSSEFADLLGHRLNLTIWPTLSGNRHQVILSITELLKIRTDSEITAAVNYALVHFTF